MQLRVSELSGDRVLFSTGTDDHGQKMFQTARDQGKTARALADELTPAFEEMARRLSCSHDDFIRTSERAITRRCRLFGLRLPPTVTFTRTAMPVVRCGRSLLY